MFSEAGGESFFFRWHCCILKSSFSPSLYRSHKHKRFSILRLSSNQAKNTIYQLVLLIVVVVKRKLTYLFTWVAYVFWCSRVHSHHHNTNIVSQCEIFIFRLLFCHQIDQFKHWNSLLYKSALYCLFLQQIVVQWLISQNILNKKNA